MALLFIFRSLSIVTHRHRYDIFEIPVLTIFTQTFSFTFLHAPCLHPKILHNHCFQFLLGITFVPREIEDDSYVKFQEVNKVHYMVYVKLVNMEDKPCSISHEFVFRRNLNVHFVALPIRSVETLSTSNFFSFVDNSLQIRRHTKQMFKDATELCELSRTIFLHN